MKLEAAFDQILYQGHPSFGTQKATFLFALGSGPARILSVEATNPWAVLCLERLLLEDGKASDSCQVILVIRDYRNVGTRHEMAEEIPFVDFMLDIADMNRLLGGKSDDCLIVESFKNALSDEERQRAEYKLQALQEFSKGDVFEGYEDTTPVPVSLQLAPAPVLEGDMDQPAKLTSALVGLGYKKPEVRKFVASLGDRVRTEDMHSLVRLGLRSLAA